MIKEIIATGKDVIEAQENAKMALGAGPLDDVKFEILHAGSKGIFGIIGVKKAQVKAWIELPDVQEKKQRAPRPERKPEVEVETKTEENVNNGVQEKPEHKKNNNKKKKKPQQKKNDQKPQQKKPEPKEQKAPSIPEEDLKMELRTVEAGEDMSFDFVTTLLSDIGLKAEAKLYAVEDGTRRITIEGEDAAVLIGHHGDTLDALQYLANLASAKKNANGERDKSRVTIDIEGYRAKREETLRALARRMAAKALRNKRSVMLEPMSAYERRIIHSEVQNIEGVSTNSVGSDNNRKIVIYLTEKKPHELFEEDSDAITIKEQTAVTNIEDEALNSGAIDSLAAAELAEDEASNETVAVEITGSTDEAAE